MYRHMEYRNVNCCLWLFQGLVIFLTVCVCTHAHRRWKSICWQLTCCTALSLFKDFKPILFPPSRTAAVRLEGDLFICFNFFDKSLFVLTEEYFCSLHTQYFLLDIDCRQLHVFVRTHISPSLKPKAKSPFHLCIPLQWWICGYLEPSAEFSTVELNCSVGLHSQF